ncbi:pre-toxin TG domain-containing protein [Anaerocolumna sp. AGMB13020]|uniref:pre-toxin TG domain-containing protein n=1 Tax=Anaerocolumna sp. AGMB13020 TaxID=3081750 RepID=UPI002954A7A9|nr:pre-toxin TG domain-containing protein [Anaerocolumna sp. AGMB13020]WOO38216.1 pre-toxin TG domain-containing protein [Anaerocolumna sp. AGMB13020]
MVRQLGREIIDKYTWLERANITMGYSTNLLFDFVDLDDLCKDIEGELDAQALGAGFSSQGQRIDEFVEHRSALLSYTSDVLYDIDEYLENPLYKGFNNAMDMMAAIDMRDAKTDNAIGLQEHTSMYMGAGMYDEVGGEMLSLNLEDFIGSRNKNKSLTNYQKVDDFADLFAKDYEKLVNNDKIDPNEETLQEYLDSLVLKEFAHKKDSPFWKELLESLSEITVVIPIIEAVTGKTLITGDYLTGDEQAFKVVSGVVSLATLGYGAYGALVTKGGGAAFGKIFAADILAEAVSGSTVIVCDKAGVPSTVTVALAIFLGSTTGVIADKALLKNIPSLKNRIEIDDTVKYKKYWDDVANGKYDIPYGMTSEEYTQYLKGLDKIDKAIKGSDDVINGGSDIVIKNGKITIDDIKANPATFSGKSADEIAQMLKDAGYDVTVQASRRSSSGAKIIKINNPGGGKNITQVQVSPGGGRHGANPYVKISTSDQGIIKIVDGIEDIYKTDGKETSTIIFRR